MGGAFAANDNMGAGAPREAGRLVPAATAVAGSGDLAIPAHSGGLEPRGDVVRLTCRGVGVGQVRERECSRRRGSRAVTWDVFIRAQSNDHTMVRAAGPHFRRWRPKSTAIDE
ncbi:hypothetical protein GCM10009577_64720 [Streptomyces javensis]